MTAFTRAASVISAWFAFVCIFPLNLPMAQVLPSIFLCSLGCGLAQQTEKRGFLRYLWVILPPLTLLLAGNALRIFLIPPILWAEIMICTDFLYGDRWRSITAFKFSLPVVALFLIIASGLRPQRAVLSMTCGLCYFVFGNLSLRQMRMGRDYRLSGLARDLPAVLSLPALAAAAAGLLYAASALLKVIAIGLLEVIGWSMNFLISLFAEPVRLAMNYRPDPTRRIETTAAETLATEPPSTEPWSDTGYVVVQRVLVVFLALAAALLLYRLLRSLRTKMSNSETKPTESMWEEETEDISEELPQGKSQRSLHRREIRRIYARYLRLIQERGFPRRKADTSREVLDSSEDYALHEESRALRDIYIRARYGSEDAVGAEDVKKARALLNAIREEVRSD